MNQHRRAPLRRREPASLDAIGRRAPQGLPCHLHDPDLWFAEQPTQLEQAKALCRSCPVRRACLSGAMQRQEPWGVWGGEIVVRGEILPCKRPRGRPRKDVLPAAVDQPIRKSA